MNVNEAIKILGITESLSIDSIRSAYSNMAKKYHPEENPEEFERIHEAYSLLMKMVRSGNVGYSSQSVNNQDDENNGNYNDDIKSDDTNISIDDFLNNDEEVKKNNTSSDGLKLKNSDDDSLAEKMMDSFGRPQNKYKITGREDDESDIIWGDNQMASNMKNDKEPKSQNNETDFHKTEVSEAMKRIISIMHGNNPFQAIKQFKDFTKGHYSITRDALFLCEFTNLIIKNDFSSILLYYILRYYRFNNIDMSVVPKEGKSLYKVLCEKLKRFDLIIQIVVLIIIFVISILFIVFFVDKEHYDVTVKQIYCILFVLLSEIWYLMVYYYKNATDYRLTPEQKSSKNMLSHSPETIFTTVVVLVALITLYCLKMYVPDLVFMTGKSFHFALIISVSIFLIIYTLLNADETVGLIPRRRKWY